MRYVKKKMENFIVRHDLFIRTLVKLKMMLRFWTGVWAVVHVEIVRNAIDILSCMLHPFLYKFILFI